MKVRILILTIGLLTGAGAQRFVTGASGLTYTMPSGTRYVPYNVVAFWLLVAITAILCLIPWGRQMCLR
jgi:hypothetical protein